MRGERTIFTKWRAQQQEAAKKAGYSAGMNWPWPVLWKKYYPGGHIALHIEFGEELVELYAYRDDYTPILGLSEPSVVKALNCAKRLCIGLEDKYPELCRALGLSAPLQTDTETCKQ
jgi:hypothetical protein